MTEEFVSFSVDLADADAFDEEPSVGTAYEVGLNGQGFMLYDNREGEEYRYERTSTTLDPPRLSTTDTPFSEAIERYTFAGFSDLSAGRGQLYVNRPQALPNAFYDSDGVNPFESGSLRLLHDTDQELADTYASLRLVVVGSDLYVQTDANELTRKTTIGVAGSAFNVAAATTIVDLASDGAQWYAAAGTAGIFRGTSSDPGAAWSSQQAFVIGYAGGRVCAAVKAGTSTTPNRFTTLNDSGAEEVASGRITLPEGWTITDFTGGGGKVWFSAYAGDVGAVYCWDLTTAAPFVALELPKGEVPMAILWYQGQVMVRSQVVYDSTSGNQAGIYRCPTSDDGTLTPFLLDYISEAGVDEGPGAFAVYGDLVLFSWREMGGDTSGLGAVDLAGGGYTKWLRSDVTGLVSSIDVWQGRPVFAVRGDGVWIEDQSAFVTTGWLRTSVIDGASGLDKVFDELAIQCVPLGNDESLDFEYTLDAWDSDSALADSTVSSSGTKGATVTVSKRAKNFGLKINLNGPGTTSPTLLLAQLKFHAIGATDTLVTLPIDCGDQLELLNGAEHPGNGAGAGVARARALLALEGGRVLFQDVDWHYGFAAEIFEVVQVRQFKTSLYDSNQGRNAVRMVAVVTLRKAD